MKRLALGEKDLQRPPPQGGPLIAALLPRGSLGGAMSTAVRSNGSGLLSGSAHPL